MKQKTISYISTIEEEILSLSQFIYNNPELPFKEEKAYNYIVSLLKKFNFNVKDNFLDMDTSFFAQFGEGHPKICYICKYSASNEGHIYGNHLNAGITVGAALALCQAIPKIGGSVVIIGCPGNLFNGGELILTKQGAFKDMDIIMCPHVYNDTLESGTSAGLIPIEISFTSMEDLEEGDANSSPLDACLSVFNILNLLIKNNKDLYSIDGIQIKSSDRPYGIHSKAYSRFYIRSSNLCHCEKLERDLRKVLDSICTTLKVEYKIGLFDTPCEELLTNKSLSRLFTNNLKECGIIDVECCRDIPYGLSIGSISHTTPCIYPSISICENEKIKFPSKSFEALTLNSFAKEQCFKAIEALCLTSIDIIEREDLLREITVELHNNSKS